MDNIAVDEGVVAAVDTILGRDWHERAETHPAARHRQRMGGGTNSMFELLKRIDRTRFDVTC